MITEKDIKIKIEKGYRELTHKTYHASLTLDYFFDVPNSASQEEKDEIKKRLKYEILSRLYKDLYEPVMEARQDSLCAAGISADYARLTRGLKNLGIKY